MSQEHATEKSAEMPAAALFDGVRSVLANVDAGEDYVSRDSLLELFDRLRLRFDQDYERVGSYADLLFGPGIEDFGPQATAVFSRWEKEGGGPSLPAVVVHAVESFGLPIEAPIVQAAFLSAILAEYPNRLQYHGNEHYRKVLFHGIKLISVHNRLFGGTERAFGAEQIGALLTASCVHDLGHEGGDNLRDGVYTPGQMEQRALNISRPYLVALGLSDDLIGDIETIVFCTDITFFAGDNSPCIRMKKIYRHYFWDDDREDVATMMIGKLRRYEDRPILVLMAMILHEADVATSAGLSYEQTMKETISIMEERGVKTAGPKTVLAFLREQLGETMFTEAGKQLYGKVMAEVIRQAEDDVANGRTTFYQD